MKKILLLLLLFTPFISIAQIKDSIVTQQDSSFEFKLIDSVSASKQELYTRARQFVALQFKDSKEVIQMDDKEAGKIICKGTLMPSAKAALGVPVQSYIEFTMTIDLKDNKYRCVLSNFYHNGIVGRTDGFGIGGDLNNEKQKSNEGLTKKYWGRIKDETKREAQQLLLAMKTAMYQPNKVDSF
jgi:hypothetical protein